MTSTPDTGMTAVPDPTPEQSAGPNVLVTVGTDHHPFDRLVRWTNDWLAAHPEQVPGFFVQSGAASVSPICPGAAFLDVVQLDATLDGADIVVCHGGPGSIAAAWARGLLPIAVPRKPELGEHVDDHQVTFCRKLAELGRIRLAETAAEFGSLLKEAARDRARFRASVPTADVDAAVARFGELVEDLVSRPRHGLSLIHRGRGANRPKHGGGGSARPENPPPGLSPMGTTGQAARAEARIGLARKVNEGE